MYVALGIVLIVAGAILTFAIDRQADGVDIDAIGWILMAAGALCCSSLSSRPRPGPRGASVTT